MARVSPLGTGALGLAAQALHGAGSFPPFVFADHPRAVTAATLIFDPSLVPLNDVLPPDQPDMAAMRTRRFTRH